ncbi:hypothetical protein DV515_00001581 [Chloebia gouldiae]|uniref:Uncharacterized protein n=1 Tax=Chloebia gouldiae TaxID=44316 RepID=A0A3L8SYK3_CHLGU|nr:hypothetical protein DV515_00001581 [Chloebia gouldiae]
MMPLPRKRLAAHTLQREKKPKLQPLKLEEERDPDFSHFFDTSHVLQQRQEPCKCIPASLGFKPSSLMYRTK